MTTETFKDKHSSCWADLQYVGLKAQGLRAGNQKMLFDGKATLPLDEYSGLVELLVNHGGLTNKKASPASKMLFKNEVIPLLTENFPGLDSKYTGRIKLHFREGRLETFTY